MTVLATVFSFGLYMLANVFILYPLANVYFFFLKAEQTEGKKQNLFFLILKAEHKE